MKVGLGDQGVFGCRAGGEEGGNGCLESCGGLELGRRLWCVEAGVVLVDRCWAGWEEGDDDGDGIAYLEVEKRMKGDVSEKACTAAVLASSVEAIVNRIVDELLCMWRRGGMFVGRDGWTGLTLFE